MSRKREKTRVATTMGRETDTLANTPLGVSNMSRSFAIDQNNNGPQLLFRQSNPTFYEAFSLTGDPADLDSYAATDVTQLDPTVALFPMTPAADAFVDEYWPSLNGLLSSGLGSRFTPTQAEIIR